MSEIQLPARDAAFAALALLRCRDRVAAILASVAEPRAAQLAAAVAELEACDEAQLKQHLRSAVEREDAALRESVRGRLGAGAERVPRALWRHVARSIQS